jgi:integrase
MGRLDADLLTPDEVEALLRARSSRAATGIRNRAVIAICWRSGLRISEALALKPKDIDFDAGLAVVQHGKNDRRRVVAVDAGTSALIQRWLDERQRRGFSSQSPVCTLKRRAGRSELLSRLSAEAGQEGRFGRAALSGSVRRRLNGSRSLANRRHGAAEDALG